MTTGEQTLTLMMTTIQPRARCPRCHHPSTRRVLTRQRASGEHAARPMRTEQLGQLPTAGALSVRVSARPETEIEHYRATRSARYCAVKRLQD
jgi:hypothetical protein